MKGKGKHTKGRKEVKKSEKREEEVGAVSGEDRQKRKT